MMLPPLEACQLGSISFLRCVFGLKFMYILSLEVSMSQFFGPLCPIDNFLSHSISTSQELLQISKFRPKGIVYYSISCQFCHLQW